MKRNKHQITQPCFPAICLPLVASLALSCAGTAHGDIQFQEVTASAGFSYQGKSWGSAWGDFDNDGFPDLWVTNHINPPTLFHNNGDGTFTDVTATTVPASVLQEIDKHGAAWADFDNDGDQDLIQLVGADISVPGGSLANMYLVNNNGNFVERAADAGIDFPNGRGRMPALLDADNDGRLDVYNPTKVRSANGGLTALFRQSDSGFVDIAESAGVATAAARQFALLGDISDDGIPDLLLEEKVKFPDQAFITGGLPFQPVSLDNLGIPETGGVDDAVVGDFDGDLDNDLFIVRGEAQSEVVLATPHVLEGFYGNIVTGEERTLTFQTEGDVEFALNWLDSNWQKHHLFIGSDGWHPEKFVFTLSPQDPLAQGMPTQTTRLKGIFIGHDSSNGQWTLLIKTFKGQATFVISSTSTIDAFQTSGWDQALPKSDRLLSNEPGGFVDVAQARGINTPTSSMRIVSADFDNDMDLDLYMLSTGPVQNQPNKLYENLGNGHFTEVPAAGGAAGSVQGRADAVSVADFDLDGNLDLFLTNGNSRAPFEADGPVQLFRNLGAGKHWIQLDLQGVTSNRDGVGSRVEFTAGDVTQLREQAGGIHARAQNHMRIHAGMGDNTRINEIFIAWPSGIEQRIKRVPVDQVLHVIEPVVPETVGQPQYTPGLDGGVYLWQDAPGDNWHLRVSGDGVTRNYQIRVVSTLPLVSADPVTLGPGDQWQPSTAGFRLESDTTTGEVGVDFTLAPGARTLLAVERDGISNPHLIQVGIGGQPLAPSGWVLAADDLPASPPFTVGGSLGAYAGIGSAEPDLLEVRLLNNGPKRRGSIVMISSTGLASVLPVSLEANDSLVQTASSVQVDAKMGKKIDGFDATLLPGGDVGLAYVQDGLPAPRHLNPAEGNLGTPNAYWLP